jgi:hypothetical protein
MYSGTFVPFPGMASTPGMRDWPASPCNSRDVLRKRVVAALRVRRNARIVF